MRIVEPELVGGDEQRAADRLRVQVPPELRPDAEADTAGSNGQEGQKRDSQHRARRERATYEPAPPVTPPEVQPDD